MSDVAFISRARAGEHHNGDCAVAISDERGDLFAVIDGLGHGEKAAEAAQAAAQVVRCGDPRMDLVDLMQRVHDELRGTRGAAMTVVAVHRRELRAAGVGNVTLRTWGLPLSFVSAPGILGARVRRFVVTTQPISKGARVWLCSDGISTRFDPAAYVADTAARACEHVLEAHWKPTDDGTVLVYDA